MPTLMDMVKNTRDTAKTNFQNWKGVVKDSAKTAGLKLGNGSGPLGMGILGGGSGLGNIRQRIGDRIAGRSSPASVGSQRVFGAEGGAGGGNSPKQYGPVIP